jgi:hypothetical protein
MRGYKRGVIIVHSFKRRGNKQQKLSGLALAAAAAAAASQDSDRLHHRPVLRMLQRT